MTQLEQTCQPRRRQDHIGCRKPFAAFAVGLLAGLSAGGMSPVQAGDYDTNAWGGKFRYGAYSTLISSHILGKEFPHLVTALHQPQASEEEIGAEIARFRKRYESLTDDEIKAIIKFAADDRTESIFEEERSIVSSIEENNKFIAQMKKSDQLKPVDHLIQDGHFASENFQFNTHRGLYNNAYYIPQNSLASIVNAYIVGIRSVEFDVLESKDNINFVIHDRVTNRLDGSFSDPPKYVEDFSFTDLQQTSVDILIPFGDKAYREESGIRQLITTEHVLKLVCKLMPELTLYADARNDAPLSLIKLLTRSPYGEESCKNQLVIKIYPFTLNGGVGDLITRYAARYTDGDTVKATQEIAAVKAHVLLALGNAEIESNEDVLRSGASDFDWNKFQEVAPHLPFSRTSYQRTSLTMFSEAELKEVEIRTFKMFHWAAGFAAVTNPLVFQMSGTPSLLDVLERDDRAEFNAMQNHLIKAAAHDNFLKLYRQIRDGDLSLTLSVAGLNSLSLKDRIAHSRFGISDRYPDFTIAERAPGSDMADQTRMTHYIYSMLGTTQLSDNYLAQKARSTRALMDRIQQIHRVSGTPVVYATTDLPTDLRMAFMGILPPGYEDLTHRRSGLIKERYKLDHKNFAVPLWSTRLSGTLHGKSGFTTDETAIGTKRGEIDKKKKMLHSMTFSCERGVPLFNADAAKYASVEWLTVPTKEACTTTKKLEREIDILDTAFALQKAEFEFDYDVRFVGVHGYIEKH